MDNELKKKRITFYETNPWSFYVFHCPNCKVVKIYPPKEDTKFCGHCGHPLPPTLPVYSKGEDYK